MVKLGDILQRVYFDGPYLSFVHYVIALGVTESGRITGLANYFADKYVDTVFVGVWEPTELVPTGNRIDLSQLANVFMKGRVE